jgi:3-dehydroquinate dehydratase-2
MSSYLVINGPNLNLLGNRENNLYGNLSLKELEQYTNKRLEGVKTEWKQSNIEGELVEFIQGAAQKNYKAVIINPGAYSHTSVAILDALRSLTIPVIEVHLSQIYQRESYRRSLLTAGAASVIMSGLGKDAYYLAILSQEQAQ